MYVGDKSRDQSHKQTKKGAKSHAFKSFFLVLLFVVVVALLVFVVYRKRETIYEYAPAVRVTLDASFEH